jgi:two-component system sensor histidine kinase UhpB
MNRPVRVLIVEDLPLTAAIVKTALEQETNIAAEYALSLDEALRRLDGGGDEINVVLLDLGLPDADGVRAVDALMAAHPETPIVVLSGNADQYAAALEAGAHEFLFKPSNGPEIAKSLRDAVIRHKVRPIFQPLRAANREAGRLIERAKAVIEGAQQATPRPADDS